jgi:hypothetical protein
MGKILLNREYLIKMNMHYQKATGVMTAAYASINL